MRRGWIHLESWLGHLRSRRGLGRRRITDGKIVDRVAYSCRRGRSSSSLRKEEEEDQDQRGYRTFSKRQHQRLQVGPGADGNIGTIESIIASCLPDVDDTGHDSRSYRGPLQKPDRG